MKIDPGMSRKCLKATTKKRTVNDEKEKRLSNLQCLPRQSHLSRIATSTSSEVAGIWADIVMCLPEQQFKFILNAAHDTLPHNANLHLRIMTSVHCVWKTLRTWSTFSIFVVLLEIYGDTMRDMMVFYVRYTRLLNHHFPATASVYISGSGFNIQISLSYSTNRPSTRHCHLG